MATTTQVPVCVWFLPSMQAVPEGFEHVRVRLRLPMVVPQAIGAQALQGP